MIIDNGGGIGGGSSNIPPFDDYYDTLEAFEDGDYQHNSTDIFHLRRQSMIIITNEINEAAVIIAYSLIVIVSLIGNSLVIKIAFSGRNMPGRSQRTRTITDVLIGSLSFSDLVMTIFNIPFNLARLLLPYWPFGRALCYGVPFVQTACVYVSTFTMAAIALHRWRMVSHPTTMVDNKPNRGFASPLRTSNTLRRNIITVWLISLSLAAPTVAFNTLKMANVNGRVVIRCRVDYPIIYGINASLLLTIGIFLTQYLIPLLITGVLYLKIATVIHRQSRFTKHTTNVIINSVNNNENHHANNESNNNCSLMENSNVLSSQQQTSIGSMVVNGGKRRRQLEVKRRRILMLLLVVIVFAICWLPLNLYHLTIDLGLGQHRLTVFLVCHWFAMSSVCYNSFIYCWLNESFRQNAIDLLRSLVFACVKFRHRDQNNNQQSTTGKLDQNKIDRRPKQLRQPTDDQQHQQQHKCLGGLIFSEITTTTTPDAPSGCIDILNGGISTKRSKPTNTATSITINPSQEDQCNKYRTFFESLEEDSEESEEENRTKITQMTIEMDERISTNPSIITKIPFRSSSSLTTNDQCLKIPRIEVTDLSVMINTDDHSRSSAIFNDCEDEDDEDDMIQN